MLGRLYIDNKLDFEHTCLIMQSYLGDTNNPFTNLIVNSLFDVGKTVEDIARNNNLNAEDCLMDLLFDMDFSYRIKNILQGSTSIFFYDTSKDIYKNGLEALMDNLKFSESVAYNLTSTEVSSTSDYNIIDNVQPFDFVGLFNSSKAAINKLRNKYFEVCNTSHLRIAILNVIRNGGLDKPLLGAFKKNVNTWGLRLNNKNVDTVFKFFKDEFIDYCEHDAKALDNYSCGFNLAPYLVNVASIIFKNRLTNLKDFVNSKSILIKTSTNSEDKATALVDRNEYDHKTTTDYPEFADDVRKIQACIDFCSTKRDKKLFVYYDKLTSVKDTHVQSRFVESGLLDLYNDRSISHSDIKRLATSICPFKHTKDWKSCEFTSDSEESKCISKRKAFLTEADTLDSTPPDRVSVLFESFRSVQYGSGGAADDTKNRYVTKNYKAPDLDKGRVNITDGLDTLKDFEGKMLIAVEAKIAADRFIRHLDEVGIDLFDLSSSIASDVTLLNEFTNFSDFCDRYSVSLRLRVNSSVLDKDSAEINSEVSKFILNKIKSSSSTFAAAMTEEKPFSSDSREAEHMFGNSEYLRIKGADYEVTYYRLMFYLTLLQNNKPLGKDIAFISSVNKVQDVLNKFFNLADEMTGANNSITGNLKNRISVFDDFPESQFGENVSVYKAIALDTDLVRLNLDLSDSSVTMLQKSILEYSDKDIQQQFMKHIYKPCALAEFNPYIFHVATKTEVHNTYVTSNFKEGVVQENVQDFVGSYLNPEYVPYANNYTPTSFVVNVPQRLFSRQYFLDNKEIFYDLEFNGVAVNSSSFNEDFENADEFLDYLKLLKEYSALDYMKKHVYDVGCYLGCLPIFQLNAMFGDKINLTDNINRMQEGLYFYDEMYTFLYNTFTYIREAYKDLLINGSVAELFYYSLYHYRLKGKIFSDCSEIMLTSSISKNLKVDCDKLFAVATSYRYRNLLVPNKRFMGDYKTNLSNSVPVRLDSTMSEAIIKRVIDFIEKDTSTLKELTYSNGVGVSKLNPEVTDSNYTLTSFLNRLHELLVYKSKGCDKYFVATQDIVLQKYAVLLNYIKNNEVSVTTNVDTAARTKYYTWWVKNKLKARYGELKVLAKTEEMPFVKTTSKGMIFYSSSDVTQFIVKDNNKVTISVWEEEE